MSACGESAPVASAVPNVFEETVPQPILNESFEGIRLRNYRFINENIREYIPSIKNSSDIHTSVVKGKLVSKLDVLTISPPRAKILELLRPEDPGNDALEAIVRPTPRRGLVRPYDEDTRRFLQRALFNAPNSFSTPERNSRLSANLEDSEEEAEQKHNSVVSNSSSSKERSLADELREAEEDELSGDSLRRELLMEFRKRGGGIRDAMERDRLAKLALAVEDDEDLEDCGLSAAARKLDALLVESRSLHEELAGIHEDIQVQSARAGRCAAAARALMAESLSLRYLDDVVALLRGDVVAARRTRLWPFAFGRRQPGRNYIV
ncbi:uncharacterized protein [Maniola hyperantus]|uniref:uncharacterized protein n=1 Tax=Aphantopus hyperantus TaxID=2795564 RepID=UPI001568C8E6|nr:uncharacterized protein LOC117988511 [Maniola hyperantus]